FRAFRRECLRGLVLYRGFHRFIPTLLKMRGYRVLEVPVGHRPRRFGRSKYGVLNRAVVAFADLLVIRWMQTRLLRYEIVEDVGGDLIRDGARRVNVLLVGLGRWGENHLRVLGELGVTLWVADVSQARLAWAIRRGVAPGRAVADYRAALGAVEAVDIVTSADSHWDVARACLGAGRHCFVEKPLARRGAGWRPRPAPRGSWCRSATSFASTP